MKQTWDPIWEDIFREQEWGKYPPEHVIRFVARNFYRFSDHRRIHLLDLGFGTGACAWFMAREGFRVSGIEGSALGVEQARARLQNEQLEADLRAGDFNELPWPDEHFDGVVENGALCCNPFDACKRVVREVKRVLKPGGVFLSANLGSRTWGTEKATPTGHNEYAALPDGPLRGRGFALLMDRPQIDELYKDFTNIEVNTASNTRDHGQNLTEWWVVECKKQ